MTPAPQRSLHWWRALFVAGVIVQLVVLYVPRAPSTGGLPIDKLVHAVIFGGVLWLGAQARLPVRMLIVALVAHAVVSELIQHFALPGRSGDPADVVADVLGVVIVTVLLRGQRSRAGVPG